MSLRLLRGVLCAIVSILALSVWAADGNRHPFFFFVMTDSQLGMYEHDQDLTRESANLEKFVEVANQLHPAFIVNCGDLVNKAGDSREINEYKRILAKLDPKIPVYNVPGNHDVKSEPTPESIAAYRKEFGRDYYTFQYEGFEGIVLDSSLIKYPERSMREASEQAAWLDETLAEARRHKSGEVVVFQHIPWFLRDVGEGDNYSNMPKSQRNAFLSRLKRANIKYVFAGHLHDEAFGTADGVQMRTVSALGKPLGKIDSGFAVVVVDGHKVEYTYYPISNPPAHPPM